MNGLADETSVQGFQYRPLLPDKQEIRLIQLLSLDNDESALSPGHDTLVSCRLEHASLEDRPYYTALSYTWGDPSTTHEIILNGQRVQVTRNLENVLRNFLEERQDQRGYDQNTMILWVDALCINQHDEAEKNQQVSQMDKIFETAAMTILWIGPASEDSDFAFESLRIIGDAAIPDHVQSWSEVSFDKTSSDPSVQAVQRALDEMIALIRLDNSARLAAITSLYQRPWFRRVWVIQEAALSRSPVVCCGREWIPWDVFYRGFWVLCGVRDYLNLVGAGQHDSSALADVLTAALDRVTPVAFTTPDLSLLQLLYLLSRMAPRAQLQASDKRDYIYALLSLIDTTRSPLVEVDYTKGWETVRTEVGEACLAYYGLCMLSFAGNWSENEFTGPIVPNSAPSWAPDWSSKDLPQPLFTTSIFVVRGNWRHCPYSAAQMSTQTLAEAFKVKGRLDLRGLYVDDVAHLGQPFTEQDDAADDAARVTRLYVWLHDLDTTLLPCANEIYKTAEEVHDALWRTPIADRAYVHSWETARASEETHRAYQAVMLDGDVGQGVKYANIAFNKLLKRRPFRSERGYIGLGPVGTCRGDSIWILPGADVPFVLRPAGDGNFSVVGEAYVHKIMDGEFFEFTKRRQTVSLV